MPADILNLVRARRQDQALRDAPRRLEVEAPRDPAASHQAYLAARAEVDAALTEAGTAPQEADHRSPCPWCHAQPGQPCTTNGAPRTTNHPSRPAPVGSPAAREGAPVDHVAVGVTA